VAADWKAGDFCLPATLALNSWGEVGSGRLGTPWERMQRAKRTAACWACRSWAWVDAPPEADPGEFVELAELEPQAAIRNAATIAAAAARGGREAVLDMREVVTGGRSHQCNIGADRA
jgi:hypothetical protein